ncbi:RNA polymerase sigma factor [Desulfosoma sp.]
MSPQSLDLWREVFFKRIFKPPAKGQRGLTVFEVLARQAIPGMDPDREAIRENCTTWLLEWLHQEGFEYVRSTHKGPATPKGYLQLVLTSRLKDCDRKKSGRAYVPKAVWEKGSAWVEIYKLYYIRRKDLDHIVNAMACEPYRLSREETTDILYTLWAGYPEDPGFRRANVPHGEDDHGEVEDRRGPFEAGRHAVLNPALRREMEQIVKDLSCLLGLAKQDPADATHNSGTSMKLFRRGLSFSAEERLVLRLVFVEGMTVSEAARALRMKRHKVDTIRQNALEKIRSALKDMGYDRTDLHDF